MLKIMYAKVVMEDVVHVLKANKNVSNAISL